MGVVVMRPVPAGAVRGLVVIVPVVVLQLLVSAASDERIADGWLLVLFVGILAGFFVAGRASAHRTSVAPVRVGVQAALLALAGWIPLRLAVAFADPEPDQPLAGIVLAVAFAVVAGAAGAATARR